MTMTNTMTQQQPIVITVFNQKGGCGKTMTTMQLAGAYGLLGLRVFVVDMDPQNTSALWSLTAPANTPFPADVMSMAALGDQFLDKVEQFTDKYDLILIDCPPALDSTVPWVSLLAADLALIPVIPDMGNVWASCQAEELVERARARREKDGTTGELKAVYMLTMLRRGNVFETCEKSLRKQTQLPILESKVSMRNAFPESQVFGCVVKSFGKSAASKEIDDVAVELAKIVGLSLPNKKAKK